MNLINDVIKIEEFFVSNICEIAYDYENAIKKIAVLKAKGQVIVDGGVIKYDGQAAEYTYDNWSFNSQEYTYDLHEYSAKKAIDYIEKYHNIDKDCFYTIYTSGML